MTILRVNNKEDGTQTVESLFNHFVKKPSLWGIQSRAVFQTRDYIKSNKESVQCKKGVVEGGSVKYSDKRTFSRVGQAFPPN